MSGDFEDGCDYMIPAGKEPDIEYRLPTRCGERVAQVSRVWESGYGGTSICHRCVNHQAEEMNENLCLVTCPRFVSRRAEDCECGGAEREFKQWRAERDAWAARKQQVFDAHQRMLSKLTE